MQNENIFYIAVIVILFLVIIKRLFLSNTARVQKIVRIRVSSIIGIDMEINKDTIKFCDGLHVDGIVNHSIISASDTPSKIIISKEGKVTGDIKATYILVAGKVIGNLHADGLLELTESAQIQGDIEYGHLKRDQNASISGTLRKI